ncbi:MAG TPA: putative metal-binding motif-containing protein, partial [Myxococcota bacterium]|nr:putative metal-binding motif-containing protein [Myxococcota bacterium]
MRLLLLLSLAACTAEKPAVDDSGKPPVQTMDADSDGYDASVDCDDAHATVNPDAPELCDGVDNNCSGAVDEGVLNTYYLDQDGDGYGVEAVEGCSAPEGAVELDGDCDDDAPATHPEAPEVCDGADNNCNDEVDEEAEDAPLWYGDADGDGYGESLVGASCVAPEGSAEQGGDCDDQRSDIHPGATEEDCADPTDYNCDGSVAYADGDADGFAACNDCNDADATVSPTAVESCNSRDDNCDGDIDEGLDLPWYLDGDGDGYGDAASLLAACSAPVGTVADATDCDDADPSRNPGMVELCDPANSDEDCDGLADDTDPSVSGTSTWYQDNDGDGYGATAVASCDMAAGTVAASGDCNDQNSALNPGATEVCDAAQTDEDCNGLADDTDPNVSGKSTWYLDSDGDSYGGAAVLACAAPAGSVSSSSDCDDSAATVHPGAAEVCDVANTDEDCDGFADDADGGVSGKSYWYLDADRDGYGSSSVLFCDAPSGYAALGGDCD